MLQAMPVQNCMHFVMPLRLEDWRSYDVSGLVGILRKADNGQYEVVDIMDCENIPKAEDIIHADLFPTWAALAGGSEHLRFDVFLMPQANIERRHNLVSLLERSCGFKTAEINTYRAAV